MDHIRTHRGTRRSVLFLGDFNESNEPLNTLLRVNAYDTVWLHDSESGINQALLSRPDFIISDLTISDGGAFSVVAKLRQFEGFKHLPMIALCSDSTSEFHEAIIDAGFNRYFCKPIKFDNINDYMKSFSK